MKITDSTATGEHIHSPGRPSRRSGLHRARLVALALASIVGSARPAAAIPAFARKYETSCLTCHTVFPKLTPFGEAFRRDGYRFPAHDSDFVKQPTVPLGQDAYKKTFPNSVWPGTLPTSVPIAVGFNGAAVFHPQKDASATLSDNGARFNMDDLIEEGHVWAGGAFDDEITFFGELTLSGEGAEVETASVLFNDLVGPPHLLNLWVGKRPATLSSFGPHSTYVADALITPLFMTALYGAQSDSWNLIDNYATLELNGSVLGRLDWSLGIDAGANSEVRNSNNLFGHVGYKLGGMPLDGAGANGPADTTRPWAETSLTLDVFGYYSNSRFVDAANNTVDDTTGTFGAGLRGQLGSFMLDAGGYQERHDDPTGTGTAVHGVAQYDELSYIVFPWLVPALRFEYVRLSPSGGDSIDDLRIRPGVAILVRPNLKLTVIGLIERAKGAPDGGWEPSGGSAVPSSPTAKVGTEVEAIDVGMAFAY
jgi:hypothetical protein